jgi:hypothetical protein
VLDRCIQYVKFKLNNTIYMRFYKEDDYIYTISQLVKFDKPKEKPDIDINHLCPVNQLYTFAYLSARFRLSQFKCLN